MSGSEFATREDLRRLESDLRDTERILRDRDDEKERMLRAEFVQAIDMSDARVAQRFDKIDQTLEIQNRYIMKKRFEWKTWRRDTGALFVGTILASVIVKVVFGI